MLTFHKAKRFIKNIFSTKVERAFYEGANRNNARDFRRADTPFEHTASMDRRVLLSNARWLRENMGLMANIDNAIVDNSVGSNGMKLKMKTGDKELNKEIEKRFNEWANSPYCEVTGRYSFGLLQRTVLDQRMVDGEVIALKKITKNKKHPFSLQMIESDRLGTGVLTHLDEYHVDGIDLDEFGRPINYNFISPTGIQTTSVPADEVIHYFKPTNRTTQYRGISEYKQAIVDLRNLSGYNTSVVASARARANIALVVETSDIAGHQDAHKGVYANSVAGGIAHEKMYDIAGIGVEYLNIGEKLHTIDPSLVGADHASFMTTEIRLVTSSRQISYELGFRDYSAVNFASARASLIQDNKRFDGEQVSITHGFNNPTFYSWLEANVLAGNISRLPPSRYFGGELNLNPFWIPPKRDWVNPLQDIRAFEKELELGADTLGNYVAGKGMDLEDLIEEIKAEKEMLKEAGILEEETPNE